ncbi:MAG: ribonuclease D [Akkermansiaceae bacterium]
MKVKPLVEGLPKESGSVGFDLEADSLYRYSERICLIQVCFGEEVHLVDPLGDDSMEPLVDWLKTARIWMHGADYDMSLMLRAWEMVPPVLYDTQIAAQLLGHERFGYASLVEQYFGVELSKSSQKADWGKRPLSPKMLEYACNDVRYLLPLAREVEKKLRDLGRYDWFLESCEASRERVISREAEEKEHWRINGCGKLRPRGLLFLKYIWKWRDAEAADWNKPSFMVANNKQLITWADALAQNQKIDIPPRFRPDRKRRLENAIKNARSIPESQWPQRPKRERRVKDESFDSKVAAELKRRNKIAQELELDPSVIAPRAVVEQLIGGSAEPEDLLLKWQRKVLEI